MIARDRGQPNHGCGANIACPAFKNLLLVALAQGWFVGLILSDRGQEIAFWEAVTAIDKLIARLQPQRRAKPKLTVVPPEPPDTAAE